MPRGDHKLADGPFGIWVVGVEKQHRVRLPLEIRTTVPWLNTESGTIDCVGTPGPAGGLQLEPLVSHESLQREFTEALGDTPGQSSESGEKWVDIARLLATSWRITISIESGRVSIPLPEPTRRTRQLPGAGGTVVVFGFGEILEIWDAAKWHEYVRAVAKTKLSAVSEAIEDLRHR
jgi:DNA-binding transcriptional regulator/RsmH inhibitor MraZ